MSRNDDKNKQSIVCGSFVIILLIVIVMLLIGYFAWWVPTHRSQSIFPPREDGSRLRYRAPWSVVSGIVGNDSSASVFYRLRYESS